MKNYLLGRYRLSRAKYWRYITIISVSFSIIFVVYILATGGGHFLELKRIILILISSLLFTSIVLFPLSIARLHGIAVDNSIYSTNTWTYIDPQHYFSENCP